MSHTLSSSPTPVAPALPAGALSCDVAIIGSGAGAGITAELLTRAGLSVVIVEEGPVAEVFLPRFWQDAGL